MARASVLLRWCMSSTSSTFDLPRGGAGEPVLMPTRSRYSTTTNNSSPSTFFSPNKFFSDSPLVDDIFIHHPQCVLPRADTHSHSYLARGTSICKLLKNQGDYMEIGCALPTLSAHPVFRPLLPRVLGADSVAMSHIPRASDKEKKFKDTYDGRQQRCFNY
jgi:hypothetical protein